jgi:hypothetical protein
MEYKKLNLQGKAKYHFNKFKEEFNKIDCSRQEPKDSCKYNRLILTMIKYSPDNDRVTGIYNKLCLDYSQRIECL